LDTIIISFLGIMCPYNPVTHVDTNCTLAMFVRE